MIDERGQHAQIIRRLQTSRHDERDPEHIPTRQNAREQRSQALTYRLDDIDCAHDRRALVRRYDFGQKRRARRDVHALAERPDE